MKQSATASHHYGIKASYVMRMNRLIDLSLLNHVNVRSFIRRGLVLAVLGAAPPAPAALSRPAAAAAAGCCSCSFLVAAPCRRWRNANLLLLARIAGHIHRPPH
jgi:hypothetical protein